MESYADIDESKIPVIWIRFTGNKSTDENFQTYLDQTKACYREGKTIAIVFDASQATIPSLKHQKMQADWLKENRELMEGFCAGTAYIIPKATIRAILKMIFSLQKQPVPYRIFKNSSEAMEWINTLNLN
jgi:hypothetical protein